jgi:hypothetical protein
VPRQKSYTDKLAKRVEALALAGESASAIHQRLEAEGYKVPSVRTIGNIVARVRGKAPRKRAPSKPKSARRKSSAKSEPEQKKPSTPKGSSGAPKSKRAASKSSKAKREADQPVTGDEQRALLSSLLRGVVEDARKSRQDGDSASSLAGARLAGALSSAIARIPTEVPPADPNEQPDMMAAAERGRAKLFDYVERARAGKSRGRAQVRPNAGR